MSRALQESYLPEIALNAPSSSAHQHTCLHFAPSTQAIRGKASRERVTTPRDVVAGIVAIGTKVLVRLGGFLIG